MTSTPLFNLFAINGVQQSRTRGARLQPHLIQDSVGGERGIAARDRGRSSRFSGDSSCGPARRVLSAGAAGCAAAGPSPGRVAVGGRRQRCVLARRPGAWRPTSRRLRRCGRSAPPSRRRSPAPGGGRPSGRSRPGWPECQRRGEPAVTKCGPLAGQRAQHGLNLGAARGTGHADRRSSSGRTQRDGVVVDDGLHDLFVQASWVGPAAPQDVGEAPVRRGRPPWTAGWSRARRLRD